MRRRSKSTAEVDYDVEAVGLEPRSRTGLQIQRRLDVDQVDLVVRAYQSGWTLDEIAKSFAIGPDTAARHLEKRGVNRRGRKLSEAQIKEAAALYRSGWSLMRLAERYGVAPPSIGYRLKRVGVKLRPKSGPLRNE